MDNHSLTFTAAIIFPPPLPQPSTHIPTTWLLLFETSVCKVTSWSGQPELGSQLSSLFQSAHCPLWIVRPQPLPVFFLLILLKVMTISFVIHLPKLETSFYLSLVLYSEGKISHLPSWCLNPYIWLVLGKIAQQGAPSTAWVLFFCSFHCVKPLLFQFPTSAPLTLNTSRSW